MIVSRELGKEQMISVTEYSNNFPRKLEDLEKYILMNNKWLVYHRPPTKGTLKNLKAKKQAGPTSWVAHMQMKTTTNSPLMIKEMIHATQIEMTCAQENIKVSAKHLQCLYSSTRYVIVGVDTFFHSVHHVKSAILSSLSSIGSEDTQVMFTIYQRRLKSFHTKDLACELSFERFRRSEQLAFHVEARDCDWNILAPLLSSKKVSDMIKNLFGKSACVVKIPRVACPPVKTAKLYQSLCATAMDSMRSSKPSTMTASLESWIEQHESQIHMLCLSNCRWQWKYHNTHTHLKKVEGRNQEDQNNVRDEVMALFDEQHGDLRSCHQYLLQHDYEAFRQGSTRECPLWLNQMKSAQEAKAAEMRRQKQREKERWNRNFQEAKEGGLDDRVRSNLSKRQKEISLLDDDSSCKNNNG
eukprot:scaffold32061_cov39-Cyclotella_meneghiniana.AAC.3